MDDLSASNLKSILHSKRANIYFLQYCRVMQKDGRVLYLTEAQLTKALYKFAANSTKFDVADLIKDALILPWAFICAQ